MGRHSLRSKAVHFVSDLTTGLLNPISDKPSKPPDGVIEPKRSQQETIAEEGSEDLVDGPDTSSFTAFLYSLLSSEPGSNSEGHTEHERVVGEVPSKTAMRESGAKKSLFSKGKQTLGKVMYQAGRIGGFRNQGSDRRGKCDTITDDGNGSKLDGVELGPMQTTNEHVLCMDLPEISEPSFLLSERTRGALYVSLPALIQDRKWVLLYSTWRHGISLSTLYRRSMLWPGLSLLVVGDRKGAVFGGLVEAPLRPNNKKKYQGTKDTFVFTNIPGHPVIFRPTGVNRYFTLCSTEFLALGGGGHFALYLDGDLLNGSSSVSETYGNPCLAHSEDFEVKEVELWGFVYGSKYEEVVALSRTEAPGICRW
ncbi:hypothetical protein PVL29_026561 [Vitis rotundifolia]|uniref:Oxidation resistance protein 1 n=1 Tax=Vitis rotundifolia TaxID=103349 RepID=A0AA38YGL9_VITRO|nr:hypothetical protein PVL29_026561 [Vitis rotundifolia]